MSARIVLPADPLVDGPTALRAWRDSDLSALVTAVADPEIPRWTRVPDRYGESDGRMFLAGRHDSIHLGEAAPFAVVDSARPERLLGSVALMRFAWPHLRAEVGYWLAAEARGQGHMTRAVRLICDFGFQTLGLERIDLLAAAGNGASQAVAERTGFKPEATLRSFLRGKSGLQDIVHFGRLTSPR